MSLTRRSSSCAIAVHPGEILQEMIDDAGVSQSALARHLGTDTARINEICPGKRGISAAMAVMLGKVFVTADLVRTRRGNPVVVFDIGGNKYRLVVHVSYPKSKVYVLRIMTHREYDRDRWKDEL